jgi:hypothetical protein
MRFNKGEIGDAIHLYREGVHLKPQYARYNLAKALGWQSNQSNGRVR